MSGYRERRPTCKHHPGIIVGPDKPCYRCGWEYNPQAEVEVTPATPQKKPNRTLKRR